MISSVRMGVSGVQLSKVGGWRRQVFYWSSSSMQRGIEMLGVRVTCGSRHRLALVAANDGLVRRPRANWTTVYMNCDLNDAEIWLKTPAPADDHHDHDHHEVSYDHRPVVTWFDDGCCQCIAGHRGIVLYLYVFFM